MHEGRSKSKIRRDGYGDRKAARIQRRHRAPPKQTDGTAANIRPRTPFSAHVLPQKIERGQTRTHTARFLLMVGSWH
jgi:hypothetical protein